MTAIAMPALDSNINIAMSSTHACLKTTIAPMETYTQTGLAVLEPSNHVVLEIVDLPLLKMFQQLLWESIK